jgi:threonine aldolase
VTHRKHFGSDNHAGTHPRVLAAIAEANAGDADSYGADEWTRRLQARFAEVFGDHAHGFAVFNGTAANVLSLAALLRPYEAVICAETAHIMVDECAAPERFTSSKLLPVPTPDGKLTPELIATRMTGVGDQHHVQPRVVSLAQVTELGTCYTTDEVATIVAYAREHGLLVHMDGARIANAVAHLGCDPRELTDGVDVLSFGATKNGGMNADAVVLLRPETASAFPFIRKQGMQLSSKMRFMSAQILALFDDDLWLDNARHSNAMARRLAAGLDDIPSVRLYQPVESNAVFATLAPEHIEKLRDRWSFYVWDDAASVVRWMTAFDTSESDVDGFLADIRTVCG